MAKAMTGLQILRAARNYNENLAAIDYILEKGYSLERAQEACKPYSDLFMSLHNDLSEVMYNGYKRKRIRLNEDIAWISFPESKGGYCVANRVGIYSKIYGGILIYMSSIYPSIEIGYNVIPQVRLDLNDLKSFPA
jgi:hypothetical protein